MDCPFCNKNNIEKHKINETKSEYVLYNIRKSNKGRCLVVPKRHVSNIRELTDKEAESLIVTAKYVSRVLNNYLKPEGFNYGFNEGTIAGQEVEHLHFHILPRFKGDKKLHPRFHVFHSSLPKKNWSEKEYKALVKEFSRIFKDKM